MFSLEEDDGNELFITQSSPKRRKLSGILGDGMDFSSPLVSLVPSRKNEPYYLDISDDDFTDIPSS